MYNLCVYNVFRISLSHNYTRYGLYKWDTFATSPQGLAVRAVQKPIRRHFVAQKTREEHEGAMLWNTVPYFITLCIPCVAESQPSPLVVMTT